MVSLGVQAINNEVAMHACLLWVPSDVVMVEIWGCGPCEYRADLPTEFEHECAQIEAFSECWTEEDCYQAEQDSNDACPWDV